MPYSNAHYLMTQLRKKLAAPKQRQHGKNLSHADRKVAALTHAVNRNAIWTDLQDFWNKEDETIRELSKKYNKNERWMRQQVCRTEGYGCHCKISKYRAWLHVQALKVNADLEPGEKQHLMDLQQLAKDTSSYKDILESEMDQMIHCLEEKCLTASMAITVCTEPSQSNQPIAYHDDVSRDFIELLFGIDMDEFALKFEAYSLFRIQGVAKNDNQRKTMTKRIVCAMVRRGLRAITADNTLEMESKRYETKIVNTHQVELVGWPMKQFSPHVLGVCDLEVCMAALKGPESTCYWRKLTESELEAHQELIASRKASGEIVSKPRKRRSDAGKKRGKRVRDDDSDKENEGAYSRRLKRSKDMRSASIIDSDIESD
ncbi:hypothetical protein K439DRAFT_1623212 [Ramaria rubella]|nr:hypothetical protein K439DRAFT_1623212 [Ramaria rubella]